ncbi:hypothetical protein PR048_003072 [Dryococelus australis]|uniref:Uncharacterized protein n=1 Tax=Dryococelus australis TaxID=614101 RepID=A0ABQ9IM31_9NEOP|nr:hypothetical protein PR048_003072 [Dryococelus australis]
MDDWRVYERQKSEWCDQQTGLLDYTIDSELQCPTISPDFVIVGFSGLPPTMVANLTTYSRLLAEKLSNIGARRVIAAQAACALYPVFRSHFIPSQDPETGIRKTNSYRGNPESKPKRYPLHHDDSVTASVNMSVLKFCFFHPSSHLATETMLKRYARLTMILPPMYGIFHYHRSYWYVMEEASVLARKTKAKWSGAEFDMALARPQRPGLANDRFQVILLVSSRSDNDLAFEYNRLHHGQELITKSPDEKSPTTKAIRVQSPAGSLSDFRMWESCRTMPLVGGFSRGSPVSPVLSFRPCSILTSITLIGFQDHDVKSHQNLFTHSRRKKVFDLFLVESQEIIFRITVELRYAAYEALGVECTPWRNVLVNWSVELELGRLVVCDMSVPAADE